MEKWEYFVQCYPATRVCAIINLNMIQVQLGDQIIRYDGERTKKAYLTITEGAAKRCGCSTCRNFDVSATPRSLKISSGFSTN